VTVESYLARIGLSEAEPPSVDALAEIHARHLERVPYENLDIQIGRPTSVDGADSAHRIVRDQRGGYCFHLNGALGILLDALGYTVVRHRGTVQSADGPPSTSLNHLILHVHDLPTDDHPGGTWWADIGLGDGFTRPLPLRGGRWDDAPWAYGLEASPTYAGGWRLVQEPAGAFVLADADTRPPDPQELDAAHARLSTAEDSGFVRTATAQRRYRDRFVVLRSCTLSRIEASGTSTEVIDRREDWFAALGDLFDLRLIDLGAAEKQALWERVLAQHEAWAAERAG
jgi:N-hydroxyarylamine O-acetyltransferase